MRISGPIVLVSRGNDPGFLRVVLPESSGLDTDDRPLSTWPNLLRTSCPLPQEIGERSTRS